MLGLTSDSAGQALPGTYRLRAYYLWLRLWGWNAGQVKKKNTKDLFDSERRFRLLVEGVVDYAIYMLDPTGIITNWNAGAERIKGYQAEEAIGQHFGMFYTREEREAGTPAESLETARRAGKFEAEGWRVRKDGTKFLASVVIDAIYEHGDIVGFAKSTRDITQRKQAEIALTESEHQFRILVGGVTDYALYMLSPQGMAKAVRARRPDLPVLLTTGYSEALAGGQTEFLILRKPDAIHELSQGLAKLCH